MFFPLRTLLNPGMWRRPTLDEIAYRASREPLKVKPYQDKDTARHSVQAYLIHGLTFVCLYEHCLVDPSRERITVYLLPRTKTFKASFHHEAFSLWEVGLFEGDATFAHEKVLFSKIFWIVKWAMLEQLSPAART